MSNALPRWKRMLVIGMVLIGAVLLWQLLSAWQLLTITPTETPIYENRLAAKIKPNMTVADVDKLLGPPFEVDEGAGPDGSYHNIRRYYSNIRVVWYCPPNGTKDRIKEITEDKDDVSVN